MDALNATQPRKKLCPVRGKDAITRKVVLTEVPEPQIFVPMKQPVFMKAAEPETVARMRQAVLSKAPKPQTKVAFPQTKPVMTPHTAHFKLVAVCSKRKNYKPSRKQRYEKPDTENISESLSTLHQKNSNDSN